MVNFYISFGCSSPLTHDEGKWITEIEAKITTLADDDNEIIVGKAQFYFVDVESALDAGLNTFSLFDEHASTFDMYSELYVNDTGEFKENVIETIGEELWSSNVFIVDRVEVLPDFRGHNLASLVIDEAIRVFAANTQLCALKAFPLQFEASMDEDKPTLDEWTQKLQLPYFYKVEEPATQKLIGLYEAIGFRSLPRNKSYMVKQVV